MDTNVNSNVEIQAMPKASQTVKKAVLASLIVSLAASPILAEAHGRGGGGWWFPALVGGALLYDITRPNYYYPPETVYVQPAPTYYQQPVYVQQPQQVYAPAPSYQQAPAPAAAQTWYYCASTKGYYPYTQVCPGGWQQVPAMPPAAMQDAPR